LTQLASQTMCSVIEWSEVWNEFVTVLAVTGCHTSTENSSGGDEHSSV